MWANENNWLADRAAGKHGLVALIMPRSRVRVPLSPPVISSAYAFPRVRTIASAGVLRDPNVHTLSEASIKALISGAE